MQNVHYSDPKVGSFDWDLPADISDILSSLPNEQQMAIRSLLTSLTRAHMSLLIGVLSLGEHSKVGFDMIAERGAETGLAIIDLVNTQEKG